MGVKKIIGVVGPRNTPIGEDHHNSKLSDDQVEQIRDLYDQVDKNGRRKYGYRRLAALCEEMWGIRVHRMTIRDIVTFRRRACTPDGFKTIRTETSPVALNAPDYSDLV